MWLLKYTVYGITLEKYNSSLETLKESLLNEENLLEANLFGEGKSYYLTKKDSSIEVSDLMQANNNNYIDECMIVDSQFLKNNNIVDSNNKVIPYKIRIRNYYDFNDDKIIFIKSSIIVDMEVM